MLSDFCSILTAHQAQIVTKQKITKHRCNEYPVPQSLQTEAVKVNCFVLMK